MLIRSNVLLNCLMVLICVCFSSCSPHQRNLSVDDPFRLLYTTSVSNDSKPTENPAIDSFLTLSALQMPVSTFFRVLSDRFGVGIVYSPSLDSRTITAEFKRADLPSVLNIVSRQLDVQLVKTGNTYYVGNLRPEDRAILVRSVFGYDSVELKTVLQSVLSEKGRASVISDRIVVAADHETVLRRVSEMLDYLDSVSTDVWVVQLCFIVLRKDALLSGGFDVSSSGKVAYNISENKLEVQDLRLDGLFNLSSNSDIADIYSSPMFLLRDGSTGSWLEGVRTPVPRKTVSDYGVVTVSGYDYINTGFQVDVTVTGSKRGARLQLFMSLSDIKSMVSDAPVTTQSDLRIDTDIGIGRVYLLGELSTLKFLDSRSNILNLSRDRGRSVLQVWGQIFKVSTSPLEKPDLSVVSSL